LPVKAETPIVHVVDDDEAVRDSIAMLLDTEGIANRAYASAEEFLTKHADDHAVPGCLVLDIRMPGMTGLELQEQLGARHAQLPIIFITGHGDIPMAVEAMRRGAVDFIRKPFNDQDLLDRIREAFDLSVADRGHRATLDAARTGHASLSPREREVFERVASGQANKVVAIELGISERTVEIHRAQVMRKMGARTLAQLVRMKIDLETDGARAK
jgi:two-component system, LuxR family, response regulator FixJ